MPKISLHVEADTPEEYLTILVALFRGKQAPMTGSYGVEAGAEAPKDFTPYPDPAPVEAVKMTAEETVDAFNQQVEEAKKTRKPRGPNKPKMAPVTEDAPEEVEHAGTVAVGTRKVEEEKPAVTERVPEGNGEVLTRMDLGDTIAGYVRKYGINFAQTDVSKMLQDMFGADVRKKSDVPEDQPSLRKAITTITQATIDNPYNRKVDVNG